MALQESAEMYLETIYQLLRQRGSVRSVDVAESMGYSKPSVSRAVGLLKQGGYLLMEKDGALTLTERVWPQRKKWWSAMKFSPICSSDWASVPKWRQRMPVRWST